MYKPVPRPIQNRPGSKATSCTTMQLNCDSYGCLPLNSLGSFSCDSSDCWIMYCSCVYPSVLCTILMFKCMIHSHKLQRWAWVSAYCYINARVYLSFNVYVVLIHVCAQFSQIEGNYHMQVVYMVVAKSRPYRTHMQPFIMWLHSQVVSYTFKAWS